MNNETTQSDFEAVRGDVTKLFADVGSWIANTSADTKQKWEDTRPVLEEKLASTEAEAKRLGGASVGAAGEMGKGFASAFSELKQAFVDAQARFVRPEKMAEEEME